MHLALMRESLAWWQQAFDGLVLLLGVTCAYVGASSAMVSLAGKLSTGGA